MHHNMREGVESQHMDGNNAALTSLKFSGYQSSYSDPGCCLVLSEHEGNRINLSFSSSGQEDTMPPTAKLNWREQEGA